MGQEAGPRWRSFLSCLGEVNVRADGRSWRTLAAGAAPVAALAKVLQAQMAQSSLNIHTHTHIHVKAPDGR